MRVVGYIVGGLFVFLALPLLVAGVALVGWVGDGSGIDIPLRGLEAPPKVIAIVSPELSVNAADLPSQVADSSLTFRITPAAGGAPLFVGLASSADVKRYLKGATIAHPELVDSSGAPPAAGDGGGSTPDPQAIITGDGAQVALTVEKGRRTHVPPPATRKFWIRQADSTDGELTLTLKELDGKNVRVVAMRTDGRPGIAVDASLKARIPFLRSLGWYILLAGLFPLLIGVAIILLIALTGRKRRSTAPPATDAVAPDDAPDAVDESPTRPAVDTAPEPPGDSSA